MRRTAPAVEAATRRILLIIGGGIAAYKSLDLIRRLQDRGASVRVILTAAAQHFVTPLAVGALAGERAYTDLFDPQSEFDVGHIRMARDTDLDYCCAGDRRPDRENGVRARGRFGDRGFARDRQAGPDCAGDESAYVGGQGDAAQSGAASRRRRSPIGPNTGEMAERGEAGVGRMAEPLEIAAAAEAMLRGAGSLGRLARAGHVGPDQRAARSGARPRQPLVGQAGPRHRNSRRRGRRRGGADQRSGELSDPPGVSVVHIETARQMLAAVDKALPGRHCGVRRAVADWRPQQASQSKIKKHGRPPTIELVENPDILSTVAHRKSGRPRLVIGFAAETDNVIANAKAKLTKKGCDWILADDVSPDRDHGRRHQYDHLVTADGVSRGRRSPRTRSRAPGRAHRRCADGYETMSAGESSRCAIMRLAHGADLPLPEYQSALAAGLDLLAAVAADAPVEIAPGARALIPTGVAIALPPGHEGQVRPDPDSPSGTASPCSTRPERSTPTIAASYRSF